MPTTISTHAQEKSTFVITAAFTDETGGAVTPSSVTWTLTNRAGTVINSREDVAETPGTSVDIVLSGNDLQITDALGRDRVVTIESVYYSDLGTDLTLKDWVYFTVDNSEVI